MTTDIATASNMAEQAEFIADSAVLEGLYIYPVVSTEPFEEAPAHYQWQSYSHGQWSALAAGDVSTLEQAFDYFPLNIVVVLPSSLVVTRTVAVSEVERRHYKKLIPFQLEEDIIDDVEELHFVFADVVADSVELAYANKTVLSRWLTPLIEKNISITLVTSAACLLPLTDQKGWSFFFKDDHIDYRFSRHSYGTIALNVAPLFFKSLTTKRELPTEIHLLAQTSDGLAALLLQLPEALHGLVKSRKLTPSALAASRTDSVNLAVGHFFPRIPLARWWAQFRLPLMLLGIGLAVHLAVALTEWQVASSRTSDVKAAITERYRAAVPVGAISDPLKQLRNQVDRLGNTGNASNALFVLAHSVPVLTSIDGVEVKNMQFINDSQELRLTIQAPTLADIDALSASFKAKGFGAEVLSVNVNQGVHQARMKVTRK